MGNVIWRDNNFKSPVLLQREMRVLLVKFTDRNVLTGNALVAKNINAKHTVVNRREWLWKPTKLFVDFVFRFFSLENIIMSVSCIKTIEGEFTLHYAQIIFKLEHR